ncbi:MAG: aminotransferase class I/II-fold pyridoxal phosphate-dependent enzyme [Flammeovirgaceae bacterium]|nr:aminotransferase class I/II-fold pyridoxal phosphate-dependent enzyme [Flammeovirgaceae bacterium]
MTALKDYSKEELQAELKKLLSRFEEIKGQNLKLDMTRGKPSPEQLDLSQKMLTILTEDEYKSANGTDCRNYGGVDGLPEAKEIFAEFLEVGVNELVIGGNASLTLMHDTVVNALLHGVVGGEKPWIQQKVKFICPSPGYDRHFSVCEHHGIEMIAVANGANGPDMDEVEKLVASDDSIKGIWCVPKYGNPTGATFSDEVVDRLAGMKTAANDFRIFWDNAYTVHHLNDNKDQLKNILEACKSAGNSDRVFIFGSTSKISFAGAGVGVMGGSEANMNWVRKNLSMQTIGPDKLNQLRHIRFFENFDGIKTHMKKHAALLRPKFSLVREILDSELGGLEIATWSNPNGGYFISMDTLDDCAKEVVAMAAEVGVKLTGAGATFPYKNDPDNKNIRLAPSLPSLEEIKKAMEVVAVCVKIASVKKLLK